MTGRRLAQRLPGSENPLRKPFPAAPRRTIVPSSFGSERPPSRGGTSVGKPVDKEQVAAVIEDLRARGIDVMHVSLDDQFRCGESLAYVQWVERLLGLAPVGPVSYAGDDGFEVHGFVARRVGGVVACAARAGVWNPAHRWLLLALERPPPRRDARARRADRRLGGGAPCRRCYTRDRIGSTRETINRSARFRHAGSLPGLWGPGDSASE